mmetsp:Transcript_18572/g.30920  ORF Transcript_18572/g.30920 Transcript_18572/m.30920 type:complete len:253 (-) Transcript_18572:146-904(-)
MSRIAEQGTGTRAETATLAPTPTPTTVVETVVEATPLLEGKEEETLDRLTLPGTETIRSLRDFSSLLFWPNQLAPITKPANHKPTSVSPPPTLPPEPRETPEPNPDPSLSPSPPPSRTPLERTDDQLDPNPLQTPPPTPTPTPTEANMPLVLPTRQPHSKSPLLSSKRDVPPLLPLHPQRPPRLVASPTGESNPSRPSSTPVSSASVTVKRPLMLEPMPMQRPTRTTDHTMSNTRTKIRIKVTTIRNHPQSA